VVHLLAAEGSQKQALYVQLEVEEETATSGQSVTNSF